jgi:cell division protein FtsN
MNRQKSPVTRRRWGRVLLSYAIVFLIGLWLGHRFESSRKAVESETKEAFEPTARDETRGRERTERSEGDSRGERESSSEGEGAQGEDLSLTFYEKLLKKGSPPEVQTKRGISGEARAAKKKGSTSSEKTGSMDAPFTIQVGSFARKEQAEALTQSLRGKGYPAYVTTEVISGMGRMYQVRIGHYRTLDEAKTEAKYVGKKERLPTYIPPVPAR